MGPLLVFALALVAATHARVQDSVGVFPLNKEVIYTYQADIVAGTRDPALFESNYLLQGELHIQGGENVTTVFLKETTLHMHNGDGVHRLKHDNLENLVTMRIPAEAADLEKVFQVQYDVDGRVIALITDKKESMWSVNIKKALASILQLDLFHIDINGNKPHSFNCEESTIYGRCNVDYTVLRPKGEEMIITKTQTPNKCTGYNEKAWLNMDVDTCEDEFEEPISSNSERVYWVVKEGDGVLINKVKATGGIYMYPLNGNSEVQFIHVNQTLTKKHVVNIESMRPVENMLHHKLTFALGDEDIVKGIIPDITFGRHVRVMQIMMPKMRNMVGEAVDYLQENHIQMVEPDTKHGQTLNRLMSLLRFFEKSHLEHCYNEFASNTSERGKLIMNLFLRLLPQVGTRAAVSFCKEMVMKHKVKDSLAIHMIVMIPMHVHKPSTTLLTEMEDLMKLGEEGSDLRKAGVLSFATLCYRTFKNDPTSKNFEEYVKMYNEKLMNARDYSTQLLYIDGLRNMELGKVVKYLEGIIRWTTPLPEFVPNSERHLRSKAIWACMKALHKMDNERVLNMMMPILLNRENHLDMRVAALTAIMDSRPSMQTMLNLFWNMRIEPCEHLYNFFYTKLVSMSQTTNNCLRTHAKFAKQIIRLVRVPLNTELVTESQMLDYDDNKYGYGGMLTITNIADDKTNVLNSFFIKKTSRMFNKVVNDWSLGVKMEGMGNCFKTNMFKSMMKSNALPDFNIVRDIQECVKNNAHIEITAMCQNRVIMTYHTTKVLNIMEDFGLLKSFMETMRTHTQLVQYKTLGGMVMPTDFGVATLLKVELPEMISMKNDITLDTSGPYLTTKIHSMTRHWSHGSVVLEVYNPILDTWHGIRRVNSFDMSLPWNVNLVLNKDAGSLKVIFNRNQDDPQVFGMISHVKTNVYVGNDINDMLTKLCDKCLPVMTVTKGEQFKNKLELLNMDDRNTGYKYEIGLFDCERPVGAPTMNKLTNFFMHKWNKNTGTWPMSHLMLGMRHWFVHTALSPPAGSCGFGMRAVPSTQFPVTRIEINLRAIGEPVQEDGNELTYPTVKWNIRGTYFVNSLVDNKDTVIRSWDMNTKILNKGGQVCNDVDMQITRMTPNEKDWKICIENKKNFKLNAVTGVMNIFMGFTNEQKCVKDQAAISIDWSGVVSTEQKEIDHDDVNTYSECKANPLGITGEHPHKWECAVAHTSLRKYEADISHQNIPTEMEKWMHNIYTWFRSMNVENFRHTDVRPYHLNKNSLKMFMTYPIDRRVVDITVHDPNESYQFTDLNYDMVNWMWIMEPENAHIPFIVQIMHKLGMMHSCEITNHQMQRTMNEVVKQPVSNEWTVYATDRSTNSRWKVLIKRIEGKKPLALRLMVDGHTKDIIPYGDEYVFTTSERMMFAMESGFQKMPWYAFNLLRSEDTLMMSMHNFGLYIEYNGREVHIHMSHDPRMHLHGKCFEKV